MTGDQVHAMFIMTAYTIAYSLGVTVLVCLAIAVADRGSK